jgi:drug/metabolite transporter (DMT)-like permease
MTCSGGRMQPRLGMHQRADLALFIVTLIWGSTFVIVKNTLDAISPFGLVASRFMAATLALYVVFMLGKPGKLGIAVITEGMMTGMVLAIGFITQTIGLMTTPAGKTAFITGLNVVMVPIFALFILKKPPAFSSIIGVILATVGLGFLTLDNTFSFAFGDLWILVCAIFFALHIIITDRISPRHEVISFTLVQMATVTCTSLVFAFIIEREKALTPLSTIPAILYLGVIATGLVFVLQTWAQRHTTPTHTALIFILEPVFAALFAVIFTPERLTALEWLGGGLILLGMLTSELRIVPVSQHQFRTYNHVQEESAALTEKSS